MARNSINFFGDYLVAQGIITRTMLDEALSYQRERNKFLGTLAFEQGWMFQDDIAKVYAEQKRSDRPFGDIAVSRGYLSRTQLADLLFRKTVAHVYLGEALLELGYIQVADLSRLLNDFCEFKSDRVRQRMGDLSRMCEHEIIILLIETIKKIFYRFSTLEVEMDGVCDSFANHRFDTRLGTRLELVSGVQIEFALLFPRSFFTDFFDSFLDSSQTADDIYSSIAIEMYSILVEYFRIGLDSKGFPVREIVPVPVPADFASCSGDCFQICLATTRGTLGLCYACR